MKSKIHGTVTFLLATIISQLPFNVFAATPSAPVPASPGPFQLSAAARCVGGSPEIDLSWTMSKGATRYDVYRNGSHLYNVLTSQTFKNQLVAPGTAYSYSVKASNVSGKAQTSNPVSATAPTCVASTPPRSTVVASQSPPTSAQPTVRPITPAPMPTPSARPQIAPAPMPMPSAQLQKAAVPSSARPAVNLPSTTTPSQTAPLPSVNRPTTVPSTINPPASTSQPNLAALQQQLAQKQKELAEAQKKQAQQAKPQPQQSLPPATNAVANNPDVQRLQRDTTIAHLGNYRRTPGGIVDFRTGQIVAPSTAASTTPPSQAVTAPAINRPMTTAPAVTKTNPAASTSQPNLAALQQQLNEKQKQLEAAKQQQAKQAKPLPQQSLPPVTKTPAVNPDVQKLQKDLTIAQSGNYGRTPGGIVDLKTGQIVAPSPAPTVNKTQPPAPVSRPSAVTQSKPASTAPTISGQPSQAQVDAQKQALLQQLAQKQKELAEAQKKQAQQAKPHQPSPPVTNTPVTNPDVQKLQKDLTIAQSGNYGRTPGGIVDLRTGQLVAPSMGSSLSKPESSQSTRLPQPTKPVALPHVAGVQTGIQKPATGLTAIEKQNAAERGSAVNVALSRGTAIPKSGTTGTAQPVSTGSPVRLVPPGTIPGNTAGTTPMTLRVPPSGTALSGTTINRVGNAQSAAAGTGATITPQDSAVMQQQLERLRNGLTSRPPSPMETSSVFSQLLPGGKKLDTLEQLWRTGVDLQVEGLKTLRQAEQALRAGDIESYKTNMAQARALDNSAVDSFSAAANQNLALIDQQRGLVKAVQQGAFFAGDIVATSVGGGAGHKSWNLFTGGIEFAVDAQDVGLGKAGVNFGTKLLYGALVDRTVLQIEKGLGQVLKPSTHLIDTARDLLSPIDIFGRATAVATYESLKKGSVAGLTRVESVIRGQLQEIETPLQGVGQQARRGVDNVIHGLQDLTR